MSRLDIFILDNERETDGPVCSLANQWLTHIQNMEHLTRMLAAPLLWFQRSQYDLIPSVVHRYKLLDAELHHEKAMSTDGSIASEHLRKLLEQRQKRTPSRQLVDITPPNGCP